jgi:hypothetical protein
MSARAAASAMGARRVARRAGARGKATDAILRETPVSSLINQALMRLT